jgi:hypothetical protein
VFVFLTANSSCSSVIVSECFNFPHLPQDDVCENVHEFSENHYLCSCNMLHLRAKREHNWRKPTM